MAEHLSSRDDNVTVTELHQAHLKPERFYVYDDGGRALAGFKGQAGDCVCRAIAIATQLSYRTVYDDLNQLAKQARLTAKNPKRDSARNGVSRAMMREYLASLGWTWVPTMRIGQGCRVHLRADELPPGRLIVSVSKHSVAVVDGVIYDTYDCSRAGTRCVYGYFVGLAAQMQQQNGSDLSHE